MAGFGWHFPILHVPRYTNVLVVRTEDWCLVEEGDPVTQLLHQGPHIQQGKRIRIWRKGCNANVTT